MTIRETSQKVIRGSTDTLFTYPPVMAQATGTPTARIGTPAVGIPLAGVTATVDPFSTHLHASADEGDIELTIASATTVRGRRYLVQDTTGKIIPVRCERSATGTTLHLAEGLPVAVASGSTVVGWQISVALTADQTESVGSGAVVEWTATLNGVSEVWADRFDVVIRDGSYTLTSDILTSSSPMAARMRPDADADYSEMIDAAWRRYLLPALLAKGIRSELFVSRVELEPAHIAACEHFLAQQFEDDQQMRDERRKEYVQALDLVLASETLWIAPITEELSPPDPDAPRPWAFSMVLR